MCEENNDLSIDDFSRSYVTNNENPLQAEVASNQRDSSSQEENRESSLAIQTGVGHRDARYPPSVHEEMEVATMSNYVSDTRSPFVIEATNQCSTVQCASERNDVLINNSQITLLGEHQPFQEGDRYSSLDVETGSGSVGTSYPFIVYEDAFVDEVPVFPPVVPVENSAQTARLCTNPPIQEPHSPTPESIHESYVTEQFEALALPKSTALTSKRSLRQQLSRHETSDFDFMRVLPTPSQPGYENIPNGLVAVPNPNAPIAFIQYQEYTARETRLLTFAGWPHCTPSPQTVADAGMFYLGQEDGASDTVCCYKCGKCMHGFQPSDNPLEEHKKYFPDCFKMLWV